jgi:integrase
LSNKPVADSSTSIHRPLQVRASVKLVQFHYPEAGGERFLLVDRETESPFRAASVYESHLIHKYDSPNTRQDHLRGFLYLYTWAMDKDIKLENQLLRGEGLTQAQIRSFAAWLRNDRMQDNGVVPFQKRRTINVILINCSTICRWFITQFARPESENNHRRVIDVQILTDVQKRMWKEAMSKVRQQSVAADLSDEEIGEIENFLRPRNRQSVGVDIATRDYLLWRMAIEFGMRLGEILAMRIVDCPRRDSPYFRIVRIEERGPEYIDPRKQAPRPKTLSRDLGFNLSNTVFPGLVSEYISSHRYITVIHKGRKIKKFLLPYNFLFISRRGDPLSVRSADDIAKKIKDGTGVDFHWHLARHAFFNRAYAALAEIEDREEYQLKLSDLVVWGGWSDPQSLDIYSRRARQERAKKSLHLWQRGGDEWNALN